MPKRPLTLNLTTSLVNRDNPFYQRLTEAEADNDRKPRTLTTLYIGRKEQQEFNAATGMEGKLQSLMGYDVHLVDEESHFKLTS